MTNSQILEPQIALNSLIVPKNEALSNSISLTQTEIEAFEAAKTQTKTWIGRVSLDHQKYTKKPNDAARINTSIAKCSVDLDEYELIEAITSGRSWSPTIFQDGIRKGANFVAMSALVADFDDGFKDLDEITYRAEEHGLKFSFVHESFSHTPARPKYRGVILLEHPIKDYQTAKLCCQYIKDVFQGMIDTMAAEPTHFYFGGPKDSLVLHNQGHVLSLSLLEKMMGKNEPASNSIRLTPSEFQPDNLEKPGSFEVFQQLLKDDYHQFIKEVGADSMAFLASLANIDDANTLLKIDVNDKTIPAKYRLVVHWIEEANKLQEQTNVLNPLPGNKVPPLSNASPDDQEKYQRHQDYIKKVRNQRKQAPIVQKAFDNICSRMIRFDVSKSRFTFDDDTVVVWTDIKKLMKEVLAVRKKPFYDGLIHNNLRNIDYDHIIDRLSLDNIYYPQQHWAQNLPPWDGNDRYRLLADTFDLDIESNEFKIVLTWFKGTMNRWLIPGSKNDNVLVIHGAQGKGKSTFFRKLTPSHATGFGTSDKDDLLKYHKYMLIEFEELDGLTKKADVTAIKIFFPAFLTNLAIAIAESLMSYAVEPA